MRKAYEQLNTYEQNKQKCPECGHIGEMVYLQYATLWTCQMCGASSEDSDSDVNINESELVVSRIKEIADIDIDGFDAAWVIECYTRRVCLRAVYKLRDLLAEDDYVNMVRLFKTGKTSMCDKANIIEAANKLRLLSTLDKVLSSPDGEARQPFMGNENEAIAELDSIVDDYLKYLVPPKGDTRLN